jgi:dihydroorotase
VPDSVVIPALFDAHVHLREGRLLEVVAPYTDRCCGKAVLMPNTDPPVTSPARLAQYRAFAASRLRRCTPLFTFKVTPDLVKHPEWLYEFKDAGCIAGKLYPEGVTTGSEGGPGREDLIDVSAGWLRPVLKGMGRLRIPLSVHPELPGDFCMDRERSFLDVVIQVLDLCPELRVVLEHVTTADACRFVTQGRGVHGGRVAATVTAHHLFLTLDDVVGGLLRPHHFCKPIAKTPADREWLRQAVVSGHPGLFLGSDSAPHPRGRKECAGGCAGVWSSPVLVEKLAEAFDALDALPRLADFTSGNGERFYGLPAGGDELVLTREPWQVPGEIGGVIPWCSGETLPWRLASRGARL